MSNWQQGLALVGAAVGAYFGQPALGAAIGSVAGAAIDRAIAENDPDNIFEQDNIEDMRITAAAYGKPIPRIWGIQRLGGDIFWATEKDVVIHEIETPNPAAAQQGSKGGSGGDSTITRQKTYLGNLAIGLCRDSGVLRMTRMWYDTTLVYDEKALHDNEWTVVAGDTDGTPLVTADDDPPSIIYTHPDGVQTFILFRGTERQEAPALMIDRDGATEVPGYKGICYLLCQDLDLGTTGRIPNINVELTTVAMPLGNLPVDLAIGPNNALYATFLEGQTAGTSLTGTVVRLRSVLPQPQWGRQITANTDAIDQTIFASYQTNSLLVLYHGKGTFTMVTPAGIVVPSGTLDVRTDAEIAGDPNYNPGITTIFQRRRWVYYNLTASDEVGYFSPFAPDLSTETPLRVSLPTGAQPHSFASQPGSFADYVHVSCPGTDSIIRLYGDPIVTIAETISTGASTAPTVLMEHPTAFTVWAILSGTAKVIRYTSGADVSSPITVGSSPTAIAIATDDYVWVNSQDTAALTRIHHTALTTETITTPIPFTFLVAGNGGRVWGANGSYNTIFRVNSAGVVETTIPLQYGLHGLLADGEGGVWALTPDPTHPIYHVDANFVLSGIEQSNSLPCVVYDICKASGMRDEDIDVSQLGGDLVNMTFNGVATGLAVLEILAKAYNMTAVEGAEALKFYQIGGTPVATVPEHYWAAELDTPAIAGLSGQRPDITELPTRVTVQYVDYFRDHGPNSRMATLEGQFDAHNQMVVDLPLVLQAHQAAALAEIYLYESWSARHRYNGKLPPSFLLLEPFDVVTTTVRGRPLTLRLLDITSNDDGSSEISAIDHKDYMYHDFNGSPLISEPGVTGVTVIPSGITPQLDILDIPPLDRADQTTGRVLMAPYPDITTAVLLPASGIYLSQDSEATYGLVLTTDVPAVTGTLTAINYADSLAEQWDYVSTFTVLLDQDSATLTSISDDAVRLGGNRCRIGAEVLRFGVVTKIAARTYTCSRLIKGDRGTEQAIDGHSIGERFTLLTGHVRSLEIPTALTRRGATEFYKIVPDGGDITQTTGVSQIFQAISSRPWAPVVRQATQSSADWVLTWSHRSRLYGELNLEGGISYDPDEGGQYAVLIYTDDQYLTIARTTLVDIPASPEGFRSWTYTAAMQTTDFGQPVGKVCYAVRQLANGIYSVAAPQCTIGTYTLPYTDTFEDVAPEGYTTVHAETWDDPAEVYITAHQESWDPGAELEFDRILIHSETFDAAVFDYDAVLMHQEVFETVIGFTYDDTLMHRDAFELSLLFTTPLTAGSSGRPALAAALSLRSIIGQMEPSLVGFWPFVEGGGGTAHNLTLRNGNELNMFSAAFKPDWDMEPGRSFLRFNSHLIENQFPDPDLPSGDWSISLWLRYTSTTLQTPLSIRNGSGTAAEGAVIVVNIVTSGDVTIRMGGTSVTDSASWNDGLWHHIVATRTGTSLELFIDGVSQASGSGTNPTGTGFGWRLGANGSGYGSSGIQFYVGDMDEVRIYNRVLSLGEIQSLYAEPNRLLREAWQQRFGILTLKQ